MKSLILALALLFGIVFDVTSGGGQCYECMNVQMTRFWSLTAFANQPKTLTDKCLNTPDGNALKVPCSSNCVTLSLQNPDYVNQTGWEEETLIVRGCHHTLLGRSLKGTERQDKHCEVGHVLVDSYNNQQVKVKTKLSFCRPSSETVCNKLGGNDFDDTGCNTGVNSPTCYCKGSTCESDTCSEGHYCAKVESWTDGKNHRIEKFCSPINPLGSDDECLEMSYSYPVPLRSVRPRNTLVNRARPVQPSRFKRESNRYKGIHCFCRDEKCNGSGNLMFSLPLLFIVIAVLRV